MPVSIYRLEQMITDDHLCNAWHQMSLASNSLYSMYGSIDWIKAIGKFDEDIRIIISKHGNDAVSNIMPIKDDGTQINILACEPYGHIDCSSFMEILDGVFGEFRNATSVNIKSIDYDSEVFKSIWNASQKSGKYFCHIASGPRDFHTLVFKDSFDEYLTLFSKKERYNLKRQCRLAAESVDGDLQLIPVTTPQQVDFFISSSKNVLLSSWKSKSGESEHLFTEKRCSEYSALAENGLLRSYVLVGKGEPWAFVLGYQWQGVFHYANIGYDADKSAYSPGTVLFYLMVEDLYKHNKPKALNFGIGDSSYKRRFATDSSRDCTLLIIRNGYLNRMRFSFVDGYNNLKSQVKSSIAKRR